MHQHSSLHSHLTTPSQGEPWAWSVYGAPGVTESRSLGRVGLPVVITPEGTTAVTTLEDRLSVTVAGLADHLLTQLSSYEAAQAQTQVLLDQLLALLPTVASQLQARLEPVYSNQPFGPVQVYCDPDRSVGILSVLWHTISFTTRGNTKPLATAWTDGSPQFSGRLMALLGDYRQLAMECSLEDASALLPYEVASLYVRPQAHDTVVMTSRHPQRTQTLAQGEAVVQFLCQTLDMVCYGGYFHEPSLPWP